jgi:peptide deformylase
MSNLTIIVAPDPRLKRSAQPVGEVDRRIRRLMDDMLDTMHRANGIGLAAPQVGVLQRVIVVDISPPQSPADPVCMGDPEIIWESEEAVTGEEGCLSLPEHYADVTRPKSVRVRFLDRSGERRELNAEGLLAKCVQHEIDHLDGILFVDHLSSLKRNIILRKLVKSKKLAPV